MESTADVYKGTTSHESFNFTPVKLGQVVSLYGVSASLSVNRGTFEQNLLSSSDAVEMCSLFFLGTEGKVVLITNVVR